METTTMLRFRSLPDLNFDTLLQIISLLTAQDVARLTRTCHTLRAALSAELPRGQVTLEGRRLTSFLAFTSVKDGRDRLSYLHTLVLPGSTYGESLSAAGEHAMSMKDVQRALPDIFKLAAHNLESLSIPDLDVFSFRPIEFKKTLDSLPCLRELELSGVHKKYENTLTDTLPHLHTLTIAFYDDDTDASPFLRSPHSTPSLQALTLYNGTLKDTALSFPTVHTLRVCPVKFPGDVDAYTHIFPNVRHVTIDFPRDYGRMEPAFRKDMRFYRPGMAWSDPQVQAWRSRFLARAQRMPDAWPHLQSIRATGHDASRLGWAGLAPAHGLARLEMSCSGWEWRQQVAGATSQQLLAGTLNELRPRCVVFHPSAFETPFSRRIFRWPQLLALQDAPGVTRLALVFCKMVGRGYVCKAVWAVRGGPPPPAEGKMAHEVLTVWAL